MPKKSAVVHARIPDALRDRLDAIHKKHLTNDSTAVVHALEAFCDYVEREEKVSVPFMMVPANGTHSETHPKTSSVLRAS